MTTITTDNRLGLAALWIGVIRTTSSYTWVGKTKEMIIDFRRNQREYSGIVIKGETVERVKSYKYLGITFG